MFLQAAGAVSKSSIRVCETIVSCYFVFLVSTILYIVREFLPSFTFSFGGNSPSGVFQFRAFSGTDMFRTVVVEMSDVAVLFRLLWESWKPNRASKIFLLDFVSFDYSRITSSSATTLHARTLILAAMNDSSESVFSGVMIFSGS